MNIKNYISSLLPSFGKDRILEDLRMSRTELQDLRLTIREAAKIVTRNKSKQAQDLIRVGVNMDLGMKSSDTIFSFLATNLDNIIDHIDLLERLTKQELPDTVAPKGMDLRQINTLQLSEAVAFTVSFTRFLCVYLTRGEFMVLASEKKLENEAEQLQYEHEMFESGKLPYLTALRVLTKPITNTQEALAKVPEVVAGDTDFNILRATVSQARLDVGSLSGQNFEWNPIYHVRMSIAESNELRFRECKSQLACFQLQLQRYKLASSGKQDARLDREIGYLEREIRALSAEIEDLK